MASFEPLLRAIDSKTVIEFVYSPFGNCKDSTNIVSPYYLKQYGLRWYLMAAYSHNPYIYTFAVDRIKSVIPHTDIQYDPTEVDFEKFIDHIIGVTDYDNKPVVHVEIWVSASELPYILSKPLHYTQRVVSQDDSGTVISIDMKLNYELEQTILSYGDGLEVLAPRELRDKLRKRIENLLTIYNTPKPKL